MKTFLLKQAHLSLTPFEWHDIPPFVVLTGANGIGKTQLLQLLAAIDGKGGFFRSQSPCDAEPVPRFTGYLPALWTGANPTVAQQVSDPIEELIEIYRNVPDTVEAEPQASPPVPGDSASALQAVLGAFVFSGISSKPHGEALLRALHSRGARGPFRTRADVRAILRPYDLVIRDPVQPVQTLAQVIHAYYHERAERLSRDEPRDEIVRALGEPPWLRVNTLLRSFGLRYEIAPPESLQYPYALRCRDLQRNVTLNPGDLSSGEQAVLALIALVVTTSVFGREGGSPHQQTDLLVLDEPDAHLHTSLVKDYLQHLVELTTEGVQIIMVTHRPDTIVLAPPDTLYELIRDGDKTTVEKVGSPSALVARLAADTVDVLPSIRLLLVEDDDDRRFHEWAYRRGVELSLFESNRRLAFQPVNATGGGGKEPVKQRVATLRSQCGGSMHAGLIDRDNDTAPLPPGIHRHARYAIESYWADPLALYEWSVRRGDGVGADLMARGGVARGGLATLRDLDVSSLQRIADVVIERIEGVTPASVLADRTRRDVAFHREGVPVTLRYPGWLWSATKDQLEDAVTRTFTQAVRTPWKDGPETVGLLPAELVDVYRTILSERL